MRHIKLFKSIRLIPILFILIFALLGERAVSGHVLGIDVETSGSSYIRHGILSIGCSLQDENSVELRCFEVNVSLPDDRGYEEECLQNFWLKHPEAHQYVQLNSKYPREAMQEFCQFLNLVEREYPNVMLISDNPSFDISWINVYLSAYTERKPLNYSLSGEYRMIWDSASTQKTWMSIKTGDFDSRHGHVKKLGFTSRWEHDHKVLNDARRITDFFNQSRKEMKYFVAKTSKEEMKEEEMKDFVVKASRVVEVLPYNPEWISMFESEAFLLRRALGKNCKDVYHVGSTAIPGLAAKPIIDIIVTLSEDADFVVDKLATIDYTFKGEFNIPMRRFFGKKNLLR